MAELFREDITVQDRDGRPAPARLAVCECGSRTFLSYWIVAGPREHWHLQCADCGESYCDGTCDDRCEHGIDEWEWCPACNAEYKRARAENGLDGDDAC